jgi:nitrogen fixation protein NifX
MKGSFSFFVSKVLISMKGGDARSYESSHGYAKYNSRLGGKEMVRVAFCSEDSEHIDSHFARAPQIIIFDFDSSSYREVDTINFDSQEPVIEEDDKVKLRINAIKDCSILCCAQIGGPVAARLVQQKVFPLKLEEGMLIEEAAQRLNQLFITNPPSWLQKQH